MYRRHDERMNDLELVSLKCGKVQTREDGTCKLKFILIAVREQINL